MLLGSPWEPNAEISAGIRDLSLIHLFDCHLGIRKLERVVRWENAKRKGEGRKCLSDFLGSKRYRRCLLPWGRYDQELPNIGGRKIYNQLGVA